MIGLIGHRSLMLGRAGSELYCNPYFANVIFLSGFNDADGGQSFIDESSYAHTVTTLGSSIVAPVADTSERMFSSGSSVYFDGTGTRRLAVPGGSEMEFADGDFTIRSWIKTDGNAGAGAIWCKWGGGAGEDENYSYFFGVNNENQIFFAWYTGVFTFNSVGSSAIDLAEWSFVECCRYGSTIYLFHNGSLVGSGAITENLRPATASNPTIGADKDDSNALKGWIDELEVTKGVALNTSSYTIPAQAFPRIAC